METRVLRDDEPPADYCIVTALTEELEALLSVLSTVGTPVEQINSGQKDIRYYYKLAMHCKDGTEQSIVCVCASEMGQQPALNVTRDLLTAWRPRHLFLVGIAGGVADRDVLRGDVIVPRRIRYYEPGKLVPGSRRLRDQSFEASRRLQQAIEALAIERGVNWAQRVSEPRPSSIDVAPRILRGELASGEDVWDDLEAQVVKDVLSRWDKVSAVENEAAGVFNAIEESVHKADVLVVKGISDLVQSKNDDWRTYAAQASAALTVALIESVGGRWRPTSNTISSADEIEQKLEAARNAFDDGEFDNAARLATEATESAVTGNHNELERKARWRVVRAWGEHVATRYQEDEERRRVILLIEQQLEILEELDASAVELAVERARVALLTSDSERAFEFAFEALQAADPGSVDSAEAIIFYLQACWQLGRHEEALGMAGAVKQAVSVSVDDDRPLAISATWLRTLCKTGKATPNDLETFCQLVRDSVRDSKASGRRALLFLEEVAAEFDRAGKPGETLTLCKLSCDLAEGLRDHAMCCSIALQVAEIAAQLGVEGEARLYIGRAASWLEEARMTVSTQDKESVIPSLRAAFLFGRGRILTMLTTLSADRKGAASEALNEAYASLQEAERFVIENRDIIKGDVEILLSSLRWWRGRVELDLNRVTEAVETLKAVRTEAAMAHPRFSRDVAVHAWLLEANALALSGRVEEASQATDAILLDPRADGVKARAEVFREYLDQSLRPTIDWFQSPEAEAISDLAKVSSVREAVAKQAAPLMSWWKEWHDDEKGPESELLDFWGRGGFSRVAAAIRAKPHAAITVDARSVEEIRRWSRVLCPLFDCVLIKWKGELGTGLVTTPLHHEYGGPAAFGGHGYAVSSDIVREHWAVAMAWANLMPHKVTAFLATEAYELVTSGRLMVLPAPLVGCTQSAVGWTDNLLVDGFLGGVVDTVSDQQTRPSEHAGSQRVLDLSTFKIPYIEDVDLSHLARVLDETEEWVRPLRSLLLRSIGNDDLRYERWQSISALENDIQDACRDLREQFETLARKNEWNVTESDAGLSAASQESDVAKAREPVTDHLRAIVSTQRELAPWIPYWRLELFGGRLDWTCPIDNPSKPTTDPDVPREIHSWLCPGTGGWSYPLVRAEVRDDAVDKVSD